jgi:hypothetical protein
MKADEPGIPVIKYGMAAMDEDKLVERHFKVREEEQAITAFHFARTLRLAPWIRSVLAWIPKREQPVQAIAEPEAAPPAPEPNDLRRSLGLS